MRGHDALIAMRMRRVVPDMVFVETDADRLGQAAHWHHENPHHAALVIEPGDKPHRLDLRCLAALPVMVCGSDATRVHAVAQACREASARRVIATVCQPIGRGEFARMQLVEATDTEEILQWPTP